MITAFDMADYLAKLQSTNFSAIAGLKSEHLSLRNPTSSLLVRCAALSVSRYSTNS